LPSCGTKITNLTQILANERRYSQDQPTSTRKLKEKRETKRRQKHFIENSVEEISIGGAPQLESTSSYIN
jgi:hypothetical protein